MKVTFSFTVEGSTDPTILADLEQAAADWSQYLNSNATLRVQLNVGNFPNNAGFIVQNDASAFVPFNSTTPDGRYLEESWGEYALNTNSHVSGSPYDILITYNSASAALGGGMYENPNPAAGGPVPSGDYDLTTMFRKALAYGLGWDAMTTTTATQASVLATPLDQYISAGHPVTGYSQGVDVIGYMQLGGPQVDAVNGGPIALVTPEGGYLEASWPISAIRRR